MSLIRRRALRSCTVKYLDSARLEVREVEVVMRRMLCWLGTASLTFMIGVAAVVENLGYRQANLAFRLYGMWRFFRKDSRWAAAGRAGFSRG